MSINKVVFGETTLIDLTEDTVQPARMYKGDTAHAADGSEITGTAEVTVDGTRLIMPVGLITPIGTVDPDTHHWVRPEGLPNLDSIYNDETNTIYMTVDATGRIPDPHISVKISTTGASVSYTVQIGHIQNGSFVADSTETKAHNAIYSYAWTPASNNYPIVKISSDHIRALQWQAWTSTDGHAYEAQNQSVIEWIGSCEYLTNVTRTPYYTEREKIYVGGCDAAFLTYRWQNAYTLMDLDVSAWNTSSWALTNLAYAWGYCVNLRYLDVSNWNTSNWAVTTLSNTWNYCVSLEYLDLSAWDTSNWKVTNMNATWSTCAHLEYIDTHTWDTSKWTLTTNNGFNQTWYRCWRLKDLDLSNWDTSNWKVTGNMQYTWYECSVLKSLNIHGWDTSQWTVKHLGETWRYCYNLKSLDLSEWDTSGWRVTTIANTWGDCHALEELNVSSWDTSEWPINSNLNYTWYFCMALKSLDVSSWDTSGWIITNMNNTWNNCRSMEVLNIANWDTSNWTVVELSNTWSNCRSLKILPISNWDTSNWAVEIMSGTWNCCMLLESLPIENWDTSNWKVKTFTSPFQWMTSLRSLNLSGWDTSGWTYATSTKMQDLYLYNLTSFDFSFLDLSKLGFRNSSTNNLGDCWRMQHLTFGANNRGKFTNGAETIWSISTMKLLTRESLLNLFDALGTVSGKTLQLGSINLNKLTADEKAIATAKGWTLT